MLNDITLEHSNRHQPHHDSVLAALDAGLRAAGSAEIVDAPAPGWIRAVRGDVIVVGFGKAAGMMFQGLVAGEVSIRRGCVVTKDGYAPRLVDMDIREAGHPEPDERGLEAAQTIESLADGASADDHVICLVSGGGSALLPAPAEGITLEDLRTTHRLLISSGAAIAPINTVRKHLSRLKGGGLARAIHPAAHTTLVVSDVVGNHLDVVASGPTVPDPTTFADALAVVDDLGLRDKLPASVRERLLAGNRGEYPETAKPGAACFQDSRVDIVADSQTAIGGMRDWIGSTSGVTGRVEVASEPMTGEATRAAPRWVSHLAALAQNRSDPFWVLGAGETEVSVDGGGLGGRCQEFALAAALELEDSAPHFEACVGILATDGTDGPSGDRYGAAGGIVDRRTAGRIRRAGLDPSERLEAHASYDALKQAGDLICVGPTGTNVNDLTCSYVVPA
jgi:hydroxypyruvate reductase